MPYKKVFTQTMRYLKNIDSIIGSFFTESKKQQIFYLRIYTYLVLAHAHLAADDYKISIYNLKKTLSFCSVCTYRDEQRYLKNIQTLTNTALRALQKSQKNILPEKHPIRVKIQAAQSICILRMLEE